MANDMSLTIERLQADGSAADRDATFVCRLASTGEQFEVPPGSTILSVLRENGRDVDSICESGTCGTCIVGLLEGEADHRDECLLPEERASRIAVCVSRARSACLVLDI